MNITKDELMGLIVEHEKEILKEGVVKPAGYVVGGVLTAAYLAELVLTKGKCNGQIAKSIAGFFKKGVNIYKNNFDKFIDKLIDGSIDSANTPEAKYTVSTTSKQPTSQEKASYTKTRLASEKK